MPKRERLPQIAQDFGDEPTELEVKAMHLLQEYYTVDEDIKFFSRRAKGNGIWIEPSLTSRYGVDDDSPEVRLYRKLTQSSHHIEVSAEVMREIALTEQEQLVADTVKIHMDTSKHQYATTLRIAADSANARADTREEQEIINGFCRMMEERLQAQDERISMTSTEQIASRRESIIEGAKTELARLQLLKEEVGSALGSMQEKYPSEFLLLWHAYVEGTPAQEVSAIIGGATTPLTEKEYRIKRLNAFEHFLQWCDVRMIPTSSKKRHRSKPGPKPNVKLVRVEG